VGLVIDIASWLLLIAGSVFSIVGGIGLLRFPDFYTRLHAAGVTDTGGAGLVTAGLILQAGPNLVAVKLAMILFFLLMTSPASTHALAKAALTAGVRPLLYDGRKGSSPSAKEDPPSPTS